MDTAPGGVKIVTGMIRDQYCLNGIDTGIIPDTTPLNKIFLKSPFEDFSFFKNYGII